MTWSYSRITAFESCPYKFLLRYIKNLNGQKQFFASYGSLMHSIMQQYLLGLTSKEDAFLQYLSKFPHNMNGVPNSKVLQSYFRQGMQYLKDIPFPHEKLSGIERKESFSVDDIPFVGILDYEVDDGSIILGDHKSRILKPRSERAKPTIADSELDSYLRQLYLYSIPASKRNGRNPDYLEFNCFRSGDIISEPFNIQKFEETKEWAKNSVVSIIENEDWSPKMEYWKCRYLCDQNCNCDYFQMNRR